MKAIILAAGVGKRLGESNENKPKCLIEFDDITLLGRHLQALDAYDLEEIVIITGFQDQHIKTELQRSHGRLPVTTRFNPDFTEGSVVSFWCAAGKLRSGSDIILMDADVLYAPGILDALVNTKTGNCFLLDRDFVPGDEPVKLCVREGKLVEFRKKVDPALEYDYMGESVGFFRFSAEMAGRLADRSQAYLDQGRRDQPYEEVIRDLLMQENNHFGFEDITGLPWIEIDFAEDIGRAENEILPRITGKRANQ